MRVLLVDDHELFREGLSALLEEEGFDVVAADGGEAALRRAEVQRPDVVLMDINMPGTSGVEATRRLVAGDPSLPVVMLTVADDDENVLAAVRAGARGYLLKDAQLEEIAAAVRGAAGGQAMVAPGVAARILEHMRATGAPAGAAPDSAAATRPPIRLTARELQILGLLSEGAENTEIAARLFLSPNTVKNQVSTILHKLGVANRVQAAVYALRHGLADPRSRPGPRSTK